MADLERIYTVPLGDVYTKVARNKRTPRAVKMLRAFVSKHMKADGQRVIVSETVNKFLWEHSIQRPPRRIKVRVIKGNETIHVYLVDEKVEEKTEKPKEAKSSKEQKSEEKKEEPTHAKKDAAVPVKKAESVPEKKSEKPPEAKHEETKVHGKKEDEQESHAKKENK
ncbi:50S ribosomal protein L31e [Candidatus Micrarchaeota archaeon]|nr:50S ribosomal protein L31e [Candidatus Micrarchaeota archaeon]MBU1165726.1 50S ribosomal protein L31e [Candidatus Micrarchaeota archaeon]MBU1887093.1 50S ribosomal protein L31e [Candidatus Micrarchaeota archaeon]